MEQGEDALPKRIGAYEVKGQLGEGGFGEVYRAVNRHTGREVAVKVFRPRAGNVRLAASSGESREAALEGLRQRFIDEARILEGLDGVATVVDVSHVDELESGEPYYVMRYMAESLEDRIGRDVFGDEAQADLVEGERPHALGYAEGIRILGQVLEGLSAAHGAGLVHRDVKPSNVLLDGAGNACVSDFGIAKLPDSTLTESGVGLGTRAYMAPEQRESARHVDARADVYAFGRLSYRVLTGRLPDGWYPKPMELERRIGRRLNDLIVSCLAERRGDRPGTAGEVLAHWQAALAEEGGAPQGTALGGESHGVGPARRTAFGPGEASARADQGPLRDAIEKALLARGDVAHVRGELEVLATIAEVDEAKLGRLIEHMREEHRARIGAVQALSRAVDSALGKSGGEISDEMRSLLLRGAQARGLAAQLGDIVAWRQEEWQQGASTQDAASDPPARGGREADVSAGGGGQDHVQRLRHKAKKEREANAPLESSGEGVKPARRTVPRKAGLRPGDRFQDGPDCPEMAVVPAGTFRMGSLSGGLRGSEGPVHEVRIATPFALGVYAVTFAEWDACVEAGGCGGYSPADKGWGRGRRPVINVNWKDAKAYVAWLSEQTGQRYHLPSESEWEYAARAGTETKYSWGDEIGVGRACCLGCGGEWGGRLRTAPVGSFEANAFGLHDMHGNVREWVEDCWHVSYEGAPLDGSAWVGGGETERVLHGGSWVNITSTRVLRGGSWINATPTLRAAKRDWNTTGNRASVNGFRVARTLAS